MCACVVHVWYVCVLCVCVEWCVVRVCYVCVCGACCVCVCYTCVLCVCVCGVRVCYVCMCGACCVCVLYVCVVRVCFTGVSCVCVCALVVRVCCLCVSVFCARVCELFAHNTTHPQYAVGLQVKKHFICGRTRRSHTLSRQGQVNLVTDHRAGLVLLLLLLCAGQDMAAHRWIWKCSPLTWGEGVFQLNAGADVSLAKCIASGPGFTWRRRGATECCFILERLERRPTSHI